MPVDSATASGIVRRAVENWSRAGRDVRAGNFLLAQDLVSGNRVGVARKMSATAFNVAIDRRRRALDNLDATPLVSAKRETLGKEGWLSVGVGDAMAVPSQAMIKDGPERS